VRNVDHDGKRFLLAQQNRVVRDPTPRLTPREHQVVACAAMGHSNKLIAYDLGISPGSVSVLLSRASTKLGVSDRGAMIQAFRNRTEADESGAATGEPVRTRQVGSKATGRT
jgi:DNA-binding CsgD family transcriptional regulator